ncbi:transglycosylase SLT domain-containing protein [Streptomyces sp. S.PNR 29]|uniref:transglycosylase SLT domain-containing protein n=1 Tax=Streptomyces sp. S.PNR 29 TaxID=2973805 RepID=UPI0025B150D7|nr:transglycosylase SLT domain-containing protein [Streptomyces sp. S.PNR 29]MDN0195139.1 transglycosylase SLT domain-containing protein [Streptomyces sp. S.PNR 29]
MPKNFNFRGRSLALPRTHKIAVAGAAALGAAAVGISAVPSEAQTTTPQAAPQVAQVAYSTEQIKDVKASVTDQLAGASLKAEQIEAKQKAEAAAAAKKAAAKKAAEAAAKKAAAAREAKEAASRAAKRAAVKKVYPNNLDGWIRESLDIMKKHGIPGSYDGIKRNILRESSGNPKAINNWDINAINGIPSKGLLQVIPPTFKTYHVPGTSWDIYDPVANITAACNYAADRYGSMDNVNSAY